MLSHSGNFTKPKLTASNLNSLNKQIRINKSQTIQDPKELVIKDVYIEPHIKEESFVRTLYRFRPVCIKSPKSYKKRKIDSYTLPTIRTDRPFSGDVNFMKINFLDKVKI